MTRDGERIIELMLFVSITAAMLFGAQPDERTDQRWSFLTQLSNSQVEQPPTAIAKVQAMIASKHKQHVRLIIDTQIDIQMDTQKPQVEKISGLRELDRLLFAKPLTTTQSKMARQSC